MRAEAAEQRFSSSEIHLRESRQLSVMRNHAIKLCAYLETQIVRGGINCEGSMMYLYPGSCRWKSRSARSHSKDTNKIVACRFRQLQTREKLTHRDQASDAILCGAGPNTFAAHFLRSVSAHGSESCPLIGLKCSSPPRPRQGFSLLVFSHSESSEVLGERCSIMGTGGSYQSDNFLLSPAPLF